jgi:hypothetical protein
MKFKFQTATGQEAFASRAEAGAREALANHPQRDEFTVELFHIPEKASYQLGVKKEGVAHLYPKPINENGPPWIEVDGVDVFDIRGVVHDAVEYVVEHNRL